MKFTELNLDERLLDALYYSGFEEATPIQEKVIPAVLDNQDIIASAQTGTGKTAAFVLPILNKLIDKEERSTNTVIIVPTRELAIQIEQQIQGFSYFLSVGSIALYGGGDGKEWATQKDALVNGIDILVATPGKLLSHLNMGYVNFKHVQHLVLDEADRMLDMGFIHDLKKIINYLPKKRQTLLFSATMPSSIQQLTKSILHSPVQISFAINKPAEGVDQKVYIVDENHKELLLGHILADRDTYDSIIIFSASKAHVSQIARNLRSKGYKAKAISSNLEQDEREEVLSEFRSRRLRILVATDVMSRGIDIKEINMVINYDIPHDAEDYVHRVGRTARASTKGEAVTMVTYKEMHKLKRIERLIENEIPRIELPDGVSPGEKSKPYPNRRNPQHNKGQAGKKQGNSSNKEGGKSQGKKPYFRKNKGKGKPGSSAPKSNPGTSK